MKQVIRCLILVGAVAAGVASLHSRSASALARPASAPDCKRGQAPSGPTAYGRAFDSNSMTCLGKGDDCGGVPL